MQNYNYQTDNHCKCGKLITDYSKCCPFCNYKIHSLRMKGKNNPNWKNGKKSKKYYCKICNKEISYPTGANGSEKCGSCALKKQNHPNWQNGISKLPYSFEFTSELKEEIRKRDNFECQNCSITEEEHVKKYETKLHIHHIDYNKQNCKEDNLITLCKLGNLRVNKNRDYWYAYFTYIMEKNNE